ncbi:MAG: hypothetical protein JOZ15_05575 [Acidobacteria bacterium]|nr:hypothetical protein [Acidobacteriota bacterium]
MIYGALSAASMLPLKFSDKTAALTGAFFSRFAIGLLIGAIIGSPQVDRLGWPAWGVGLLVGLLVSAPDAIVTKTYVPILAFGAVGGALIGWIVQRWGV